MMSPLIQSRAKHNRLSTYAITYRLRIWSGNGK